MWWRHAVVTLICCKKKFEKKMQWTRSAACGGRPMQLTESPRNAIDRSGWWSGGHTSHHWLVAVAGRVGDDVVSRSPTTSPPLWPAVSRLLRRGAEHTVHICARTPRSSQYFFKLNFTHRKAFCRITRIKPCGYNFAYDVAMAQVIRGIVINFFPFYLFIYSVS
jgi:hypothetical protein